MTPLLLSKKMLFHAVVDSVRPEPPSGIELVENVIELVPGYSSIRTVLTLPVGLENI